jgi:esterase
VYVLDLRNHRHALAASQHTHSAMASDVLAFLDTHYLSRVRLIGYSMGGKAAMAAVLAAPRAVEKLVVADIAPAPITISPTYSVYVHAMEKMQDMGLRSRKDAHAVLRETESVRLRGTSAGSCAKGAS